MIESIITPERILLRDADGEAVFDTHRAKVAVLAMFDGTFTSEVHPAPASGVDVMHRQDHDIGAAPLGAERILGWITVGDGSRQDFSGTVQLGAAWWRNTAEFYGGYPVYPRIAAAVHTLTPLILGGRIILREEWFVHGCQAGSSPLRGWPCGMQWNVGSWKYDLRVCAFVGGS